MKTPIILFAYNRPAHLIRTVEALQRNYLARESDLIIFSDYGDGVKEVRKYLDTIIGFKSVTIIKRKTNYGLAKNIIEGVSDVFKSYKRVIVLEDDLLTSPDFLNFMTGCLDFYKGAFSISGYAPGIYIPDSYTLDTYLSHRPCSWGWATWRSRWNAVNWDIKGFNPKGFDRGGKDLPAMFTRQIRGEIDSWAVRFAYTCHSQNNYCVYPVRSKVDSIGEDGSGTHTGRISKFDLSYPLTASHYRLNELQLNTEIIKSFADFFKPSILRRGINYFKY